MERELRIACMLRDPYPPFRPDVAVLFGERLPERGIRTDLFATRDPTRADRPWPAGRATVRRLPGPGWFAYLCQPLVDLPVLRHAARADIVQARDRIRAGVVGVVAARLHRRPFVYWMSFPIAQGHAVRAREIAATRGSFVAIAFGLRAALARQAEAWVLRQADHVFVQSDAMRDALSDIGIDRHRMTVIPMGIETERLHPDRIEPIRHPVLTDRRPIVYLGTLGRARRTDFLLDVMESLVGSHPDALLLLVGDAVNRDDREWLQAQLRSRRLERHVHLTGWLSPDEALAWVAAARIGLSPIPRGPLFDVSSPTKVGEYLALGLPCVANDIPDQRTVLEASGGGRCVPMTVEAFTAAIASLLDSPDQASAMGRRGASWIREHRSYERLAEQVATSYRTLIAEWSAPRSVGPVRISPSARERRFEP